MSTGKSCCEERLDAVTQAMEAVTNAAQNAQKEEKKNQPESVSNESAQRGLAWPSTLTFAALAYFLIQKGNLLESSGDNPLLVLHLAMRREKHIAEVAMARKIAVRLYWMRFCFESLSTLNRERV